MWFNDLPCSISKKKCRLGNTAKHLKTIYNYLQLTDACKLRKRMNTHKCMKNAKYIHMCSYVFVTIHSVSPALSQISMTTNNYFHAFQQIANPRIHENCKDHSKLFKALWMQQTRRWNRKSPRIAKMNTVYWLEKKWSLNISKTSLNDVKKYPIDETTEALSPSWFWICSGLMFWKHYGQIWLNERPWARKIA